MSLENLLKSGINGNTLIWHYGLSDWTPARNLEELKPLFDQKPPAFEAVQPPPLPVPPPPFSGANSIPQKRSGFGRRIGKAIVFLLITAGILFSIFIYNMQNRGGYASHAAYSENKISVGDYERMHPAEFLDATGTYNETLFGNKIKVHASVTNRATVANFKDIVIEVSYYSATKTLINTERFVLYEYVPAHSQKDFEWKIKPPGGTNTISWDAVDAKPY